MNILRPISPIIKKFAQIYTSKEREFTYKDISVTVLPGVFHPGMFFSTKILLGYIENLDLSNTTFLELGAGTGIISVLASKKGAIVTASDISSIAVKNIQQNSEINKTSISVINSDLFEKIPQTCFDYIIINPPYYKKDPQNEEDYAWNCGSDFQYYRSLFRSLLGYLGDKSKVIIILSEVSDIDAIRKIGELNGFDWKVKLKKTVLGEKNFIFELISS